jgi:shikimate kinase
MIFLIGFMGSGKTSVGKRLAQLLNFEFIDLDEVIENSEGQTISQIFHEHSEEYFRSRESFFLQSLIDKKSIVVATGGGTPCFHSNMQWMLANGITIYLNTDAEVLFQRLKPEMAHRPLLKQNSEEELRNFIAAKLKERESFYGSSKFIVDTSALSADQLTQKIYSLLV